MAAHPHLHCQRVDHINRAWCQLERRYRLACSPKHVLQPFSRCGQPRVLHDSLNKCAGATLSQTSMALQHLATPQERTRELPNQTRRTAQLIRSVVNQLCLMDIKHCATGVPRHGPHVTVRFLSCACQPWTQRCCKVSVLHVAYACSCLWSKDCGSTGWCSVVLWGSRLHAAPWLPCYGPQMSSNTRQRRGGRTTPAVLPDESKSSPGAPAQTRLTSDAYKHKLPDVGAVRVVACGNMGWSHPNVQP